MNLTSWLFYRYYLQNKTLHQNLFNDSGHSHGSCGVIKKLRRHGKSRHTKTYGEHRGQISISNIIHERPLEAQQRGEVGHWEVDTVVGKSGGSCLVNMVDRKTCYLLTKKADYKRALSVNQAMGQLMDTLPNKIFKTMTPDRGSEFAKHAEITKDRLVLFYFPDAYAPWQRGSNENINGLLREYMPKEQDLSQFSDKAIATFAQKINTRLRKCLSWKTPYEVFYQQALHLI